MSTDRKHWTSYEGVIPDGACLYALEKIELFSKSDVLLWKLGRTKNLGSRIRGYPDPVAIRFLREIQAGECAKEEEGLVLQECPFPRCHGREWFRASLDQMGEWLLGGAYGQG